MKMQAKTRQVSPPGHNGIESVTALGNISASPISNYFCKGYKASQKYSIGKYGALNQRKKRTSKFPIDNKDLFSMYR